jgi:membrane-associated phospholipid phosphatase
MISTDTPANVIEGTGAPHERTQVGLRGPRPVVLVLLSGYLAASGLVLALGGNRTLALVHAVVIGVALWCCFDHRRLPGVIGDLLPLFAAPVLYVEIPDLIEMLGTSYHDALVQGWEAALFGAQPARTFAEHIPSVAVSEILHAGYLSYYPAIFVPPLLLYARGHRRGFAQTVFALTTVYLVCWTIFAVMPVQGPRYLWTPTVPDGPARRLAVTILTAGSSRGAAFPSSHMAVAVVQAIMALRWQRGMGVILTVTAALVGLGAVYGGFHYGVDMIAGALLGVLVSGATLLTNWRDADLRGGDHERYSATRMRPETHP